MTQLSTQFWSDQKHVPTQFLSKVPARSITPNATQIRRFPKYVDFACAAASQCINSCINLTNMSKIGTAFRHGFVTGMRYNPCRPKSRIPAAVPILRHRNIQNRPPDFLVQYCRRDSELHFPPALFLRVGFLPESSEVIAQRRVRVPGAGFVCGLGFFLQNNRPAPSPCPQLPPAALRGLLLKVKK